MATMTCGPGNFAPVEASLCPTVRNGVAPLMVCFAMLDEILGEAFEAAKAAGMTSFPAGIEASTPLNSAPYLIDLTRFAAEFAFNDHRREQLAQLKRTCNALRSLSVTPSFVIVGGSYLDVARETPKDLDAALFYLGAPQAPSPSSVSKVQSAARDGGVDLRLVPFDVEPAFVAKMIGYFVLLYAQSRGPSTPRAGLVVSLAAT
jgi:hypothetical protein